MSRRSELSRLLRWYPTEWRHRYGEAFLALLEDQLAGTAPTLRFRLMVVASGMRERAFVSGVAGTRTSPATQRRSGSLIVLIAWSLMVLGGASFSKMSEHSAAALPAASQSVAQWAYDAAVVAGATGTLLVVVGTFIVLPSFLRFLRTGGWPIVRRSFVQALVTTFVLAAATIGVRAWAHHLDSLQRNGGDPWYSAVFLGCALLVATVVYLWTRAAVLTVAGLDVHPRALLWESWLALGVTLSAIVVAAGTATWWIQKGLHAPWFFQGTRVDAAASPWSTPMVVTAFIMILAMATALWGAGRVALTFRPLREGALVIGGRGGT